LKILKNESIGIRSRFMKILVLILLTSSLGLQSALSKASANASIESINPNADSEYELGKKNLHGRGAEKNPEKALEQFQKAAELGHIEAPGAIGYFYTTGLVVEKNDAMAVECFQKGADNGSAAAKFNLGKFYFENRGGVSGVEQGLKLMTEASELGLMQAHATLAEIYYLGGDRIPIDHKKAYLHAEIAANAGTTTAETMLGVMKEYGYGTPVDTAAAEKWFRKAAQKGEFKAQSNLGHLLDPSNKDRKKRIEAAAWLIIAASQNEPLAVRTIEEVEQSMPKKDFSAARDMADVLQKKIAEATAK
jgi:hypothetical protein